ncbi:Uncharacterized protein XB16_2167 [Leptospira santarosai]|uniref:Uncharacterized protein n=1 Tax=Leptospira santarosai TaxID=28183 RepID=A0A2P1QUA5_9LEPT|nr:Uncharacterized protein XB16_2167 [Leptospira santarosai]
MPYRTTYIATAGSDVLSLGSEILSSESDQSATGLLDSVESRISHRTALCSRNILIYGSQRPLTLFAELNDTALYGSQRQVLGHAVNCFHVRMTYSENLSRRTHVKRSLK